jgi:hypothetical protein
MRIASSAARRICAGAAFAIVATLSLGVRAEPLSRGCAGTDYNAMILDIIKGLPSGGGYSRGGSFQLPTITAHNIGAGHWEMRVYDGFPSHCTSATYALLTRLIAVLQDSGRIALNGEQIESLAAKNRMPDGTTLVDGQGAFQIFNANGAGTAALLKHTGTGINFRDDKLAYARPGDFLKMFWNDNVGASEQGHQVVYLGHKTVGSRDMLCFWGSQRQNKKKRPGGIEALYFPATDGAKVEDGYGEACRPRSDVKAMIFSRVTCMEHLAAGLDDMSAKATASRGAPFPFVDEFLVSLSKTSSDQATLDRVYGILAAPDTLANLAPEAPQ